MRHRTRLAVATALATLVSLVPALPVLAIDPPDAEVFVSEFHYDNDGTDTNEAIEIQGPTGASLDGWQLVLYNGNGGATYDTESLGGPIPDSGVVVIDFPSNGIQNGDPDGIALVDEAGNVVQFISYEGTLTATNGPANGVESTDIGVAEGSSTAIDQSLQRSPAGTWTGPACASFGAINDPDAATTCGAEPVEDVRVNELHYDNTGTDEGEAIEVYGPADANLTGWQVVLYNGSNGEAYDTTDLPQTIPDLGGGFGVITLEYGTNGIQNGAPDAIALVDGFGEVVEFVSYEGTFTGVGGPADGLTSTDIGVAEGSDTTADQSLQRLDDLTWQGPVCASFGELNDPDAQAECPQTELPDVRFSEIHYDNDGGDTNEAIEVYGPAGSDLTGWEVVLYNGSNGSEYGSETLTGTIPDSGDGTGVVVADSFSSIQNGSPDGFALYDAEGTLVEFLSYEGTLTVDGVTSEDIGVSEGGSTAPDQSLQRDVEGNWDGPFCASFGQVNDPNAPTDCPTEPTAVFIHDVQGDGETTPLDGQTVIVEGIVTSDFQTSEDPHRRNAIAARSRS